MKPRAESPMQQWFGAFEGLSQNAVPSGKPSAPAKRAAPVQPPAAPAPPPNPGRSPLFLIDEHAIRPAPLTEASPGKWVPTLRDSNVRKYFFVELRINPDGTPTAKFRRFPTRARISVVAEATGLSVQSLVRLGKNIDPTTITEADPVGKTFIQFSTGTPNTRMVDLHSVVLHFQRCEDPDFWTPKRRKAFNKNVY